MNQFVKAMSCLSWTEMGKVHETQRRKSGYQIQQHSVVVSKGKHTTDKNLAGTTSSPSMVLTFLNICFVLGLNTYGGGLGPLKKKFQNNKKKK